MSASRCRGSLVLATADRNRRLPLCWRAPSCRQKKTHNHLSVNQWLRSAIFAPQQHSSPIGFLFLKLPPPPCAVLLVYINHHEMHEFTLAMKTTNITNNWPLGKLGNLTGPHRPAQKGAPTSFRSGLPPRHCQRGDTEC